LLVVAAFFLPIFLERGIYTMPQFLETRFGPSVKTVMAVFWLFLFTAVNLTTVLYGGALAINAVTGLMVFPGMALLAAFALLYSLYGGLKAVALTDIIQVVVLILGGISITLLVLGLVGGGADPVSGLTTLMNELPGHFEMILDRDHPEYQNLPGIWTLLGGLWVLHFSYWGFNQYIIQRALGAESLPEAQRGLAFAALLKFLIPLIVVVPRIAALWMEQNGMLDMSALDPGACRWNAHGTHAQRYTWVGVRRIDRCNCVLAGINDQFDFHDIHNGYLLRLYRRKQKRSSLCNNGPYYRCVCYDNCTCSGATLAQRQHEHLSNHTGIYRLRCAGNCGGVCTWVLLEAYKYARRVRIVDLFSRVVFTVLPSSPRTG
jgi:hypothetical protein